MRFPFNISLLLLLLFAVSCEVKMPEDIIQPEKMEAVLYDYHLVQAMSSEYSSSSYKEKLFYRYVFDKHNISKEQFDSSLVWYNRYPKHMVRIYTSIEERLEKEIEAFGESKGMLEDCVSLDVAFLGTDTAELWTSPTTRVMLSNPLNNAISFAFTTPQDSAFVPRDSLVWSFKALFAKGVAEGVEQGAYASLLLRYDDGTSATNAVHITASGNYSLAVERKESRLKGANGYIYYSDNDTTAQAQLVLTDISLRRMHPATEAVIEKKR